MQLVTPQTSAEVHKVLVAEDVYYPGESETFLRICFIE
jgi:succinyl-CoA synthetase beta subunit